jgi:dTDP-4-amino-4,6-dideoxygalactose transaminase
VVAPAYTCYVVHQALSLSGAQVSYVDSAPGSFLMPLEAVRAASRPDATLVFCEMYGIPYDLDEIERTCGAGHRLRIFDMAMSIASPDRIRRLGAMDAALYSFGWAKPMYAGRGSIVCLQDATLAAEVRQIRDRWTMETPAMVRIRRQASILLNVMLNERLPFALAHEPHLYDLRNRMRRGHVSADHPPDVGRQQPSAVSTAEDTNEDVAHQTLQLSPEWTEPPTPLSRGLAMHNVRGLAADADLRREQAEMYWKRFEASGIGCGTGRDALPQSHFVLRLPATLRDAVCDFLMSRGIGTSTFSWFTPTLSRDSYPNAAQSAAELVALPLGPSLRKDEIGEVVRAVKDGVQLLGPRPADPR